MKSPFQKPARGPSPDGLDIAEAKLWDERLASLRQQHKAQTALLPALIDASNEASLLALTEPSPATIKADETAAKAVDAVQSLIAKLARNIEFALAQKILSENKAAVTKHKRDLNTVHRNLDKRDDLAADFTTKVKDFLQAFDAVCVANDGAYSIKPIWPDSNDNNLGLSPASFRWKVAHEIWRIASELGVKWPEAARESTLSDRDLTLADRLKRETAGVMDRLRQRPVPGTPAPVAEALPATITPVEQPSAAPVVAEGPTVSAQSIPLRSETLTV